MKLLSENELIWSTVVANSTMNRSRNASGLNSYEKEFRFQPAQLLLQYIDRNGSVLWLDLCCGEGRALIQSASFLASRQLQHQAQLLGIDLIDGFQPIPTEVTCLQWQVTSVTNWLPKQQFDIITCVHGLHYIGDRLQAIQKACDALTEEGIFIANLDLRNIKVAENDTGTYLKKKLREYNIQYNARQKVITCKGRRQIEWGLQYMGANDKAGPNYTGQEAVDAYYSIRGD